jgi:uncharacterized membrane-anchored protein
MVMSEEDRRDALSKVPAVTLGFWVIKITATTLGETAGDTVSMTLNLGYLVGTAIFATLLVAFVAWQIRAKRFHPFLYWATIIASTTAGTTMADFADRSLGIGYPGGATLLLACVLASLAAWRWTMGTVAVETVRTPKAELFYWVTITFSQTLGTALGDWVADAGPGYQGGALIFGAALLAVLGGLHPHPPARGDRGRLAGQAGRRWRARVQPPARLRGAGGVHPGVPAGCPAARGLPPGLVGRGSAALNGAAGLARVPEGRP